MFRLFAVIAGSLVVALATSIGGARAVAQREQPSSAPVVASLPPQAVLSQYCVTCHNQRLKTGGLALDTLDLGQVGEHAAVWEKVVKKLRAGVMPPAGRPRPDAVTYERLTSFLETQLDRASAVNPNPGRTEALHRLNRAEYQNAIRDILAVDVDVESLLPADGSSYGFDNIAGVQRMSPGLLSRYLRAAEKVTRLALGALVIPSIETFTIREDFRQDDRLENLPFGSRGGALIRYNFPMDGDYSIAVKLVRRSGPGEEIPEYNEAQPLAINIDGRRVGLFTLAARSARPRGRAAAVVDDQDYGTERRTLDANWRVNVPVKAGERDVAITFVNRTPVLLENFVQPFQRAIPQGQAYTTEKGAYLRDVEISGPFNATGPGQSLSRQRIFVCRPARPTEEAACAKTILLTLARRAFRRPVSDADIRPLLSFYNEGRTVGGFEAGVERALQALLMSPEFLFRAERAPANLPVDATYRVSDTELASRLSFFLWSSVPDDELIDLAAKRRLRDPAVFEQQARRMLADPRSRALVSNFAGQWLSLRNVPALERDSNVAPDFDEDLRQAFRRETELFVDSIIREDRSLLELLSANYTFVNERLARHYGIPNIYGSHFRRVTVTDENRRGLLGQGSFLSVNASPNRTSPVMRGKWILTNILGTPPPEPPANVPALKEERKEPSDKVPSMRERMNEHRANPICASCHSVMDPLGFALENFDFVGKWREVDESWQPIDPSGTLPDGTTFTGVAGLREALLGRSDLFVHTATEKLLTYALGRGVESYDEPALRKIVREAAPQNYRFSSLILGVVRSLPFQMRRASPEQPTLATADAHP